MVRRATVVALQGDLSKLRTHHNEVLRQAGISQQSAVNAGEGGRGVDEVCEATDVAIGNELIRRRQGTKCLRAGDGRAVHDSNAGNVQAHQQPIKQLSVAAGACDVERLEDAVPENVGVVEIGGAKEFRRLVADPTDIQGEVLGKFSLYGKIEALNVRNHPFIGISTNVRNAVRQRNGSKWFGATGRHRNHSRSREARQIQICRWRVRDVQCLSREIADVARVTEKIGGARVVDAVS